MNLKIIFLLSIALASITAFASAYGAPVSELRIIAAVNELDEFSFDPGGIVMVAPISGGGFGTPTVLIPADGTLPTPEDLVVYGGDIFVVDTTNGIFRIELNADGTLTNSPPEELISDISNFGTPLGIDVSSGGILYIADETNNAIYRLDSSVTTPTTPTLVSNLPTGTVVKDLVIDNTNQLLYVLSTKTGGPGIYSIDLTATLPITPTVVYSGDLFDSQQIEVLQGTTIFYVTQGEDIFKIQGASKSNVSDLFGYDAPYGLEIDENPLGGTGFDIYVSDSNFENLISELPGAIFRLDGNLSPPIPPVEESNGTFLRTVLGIDTLVLTASPVSTDLGVYKIGPSNAAPGDTIVYTIYAKNYGPGTVADFILSDNLPDQNGFVDYDSHTATKVIGGTSSNADSECVEVGLQQVSCSISGPFATGDFARIDITGTIQPASTGPLTNNVILSSQVPFIDPSPGNLTFSFVTSLSQEADFSSLTMTTVGGVTQVTAGQTPLLEYDITFTNEGDDATNVVLEDTLPPGVTFVSTNKPSICSESAGIVTCDFGSISNNDSGDVRISVSVDPNAMIDPLTNSASITCDQCTSPFTTSLDTDLLRVTNLAITSATATPSPVTAGDPLDYDIQFSNSGPSTASNVIFVNTLPSGVTLQNIIAPGFSCTPLTVNSVVCTISEIQPLAITDITLELIVDSNTLTDPLINSGIVTSDEDDGTDGDNDYSVSTPLETDADIISTITAPSSVTPGQTFDYTIDVLNNGPSDALDLKYTINLPSELIFVPSTNNCQEISPGLVECHDPFNQEDVEAGSTVTKLVSVQVDPSANQGPVTVDGDVFALDTTDPNETNNVFSLTIEIEANVADLEIEKSSEVITTGETSGVIHVRVSQSSDDAEENDDDVYVDDDDLDMNEKDYVGLRFQEITIPQGATITNAYVQFTVEDENGDTGNAEVIIYGQDSDSTLTFSTSDNDISSRPPTSAFVEWDIPNWHNEDDSGPAQTTPDLSPIIQEIVDRSGWASQSIVIIIEEDKGKDRDAKAWDLDPTKAPLLHIEYDNNDEITEVIYTLTITNNGPGDATNVNVIDNLPPEVTATNVVPASECSIDNPQLVTCDFALITSGSQEIVTIDTTLDPGTTGTITNIASVSGDQNDPDETNNEVTHETTIGGGELFCGRSISEFNVIDGTPNNDVLIGTHDDDLIRGFGGNDHINAKKGDDCIFGGDGHDKILGGHGEDTIEGNDGKDRIFGGKGNDIIFGGEGKDRLMGGLGNDEISGGEGDDTIRAGNDDDIVNAGPGNDKIFGQSGNDELLAGSGNDKVFGGNGNDFLDGGPNNDLCKGGPGNDVIINCEYGDSSTSDNDDDDKKDKKTYVCHEGEKLKIKQSELQVHLDHGDSQGKCIDNDDEETDCECEKPSIFTVQYNGPSDVTVEIYKKEKDIGKVKYLLTTFNDVDDGENIVLDSSQLDKKKIESNTVYRVLDGSTEIGVISIHTSCSKPLFLGDEFSNDGIVLTIISGIDHKGESSIPPLECKIEN